jgi:hypothetical protein
MLEKFKVQTHPQSELAERLVRYDCLAAEERSRIQDLANLATFVLLDVALGIYLMRVKRLHIVLFEERKLFRIYFLLLLVLLE